jgi:hypothetical protein
VPGPSILVISDSWRASTCEFMNSMMTSGVVMVVVVDFTNIAPYAASDSRLNLKTVVFKMSRPSDGSFM